MKNKSTSISNGGKFLRDLIKKALEDNACNPVGFSLEHPDDLKFGDYSTNAALVAAKDKNVSPKVLAIKIVESLRKANHPRVKEISIDGPGFINFSFSRDFLDNKLNEILGNELYGNNNHLSGKTIMVEYTDPNPFKEFHIGHLMSNAIGESLSRLYEYAGAKVVRATYGGDVGLHVAKAVWAIEHTKKNMPKNSAPLKEKTKFLGEAYARGAKTYEGDEKAKEEIQALNKIIFEKSNLRINEIYEWGRKASLEHFEEVYKKVGTKFDHYFFESEVSGRGEKIVREFLGKGTFEESNGAIIYSGEKHGLHTRVFINNIGIPTYEAKELGLNKLKFDLADLDYSVIVAASEQSDYFRVLLRVMQEIYPSIGKSTRHIAHGMLRFASGKMSSRKGNVITGESFIEKVKKNVSKLMKERELSSHEKNLAEKVAVAAIKYSILKQSPGKDIIFDAGKSISFEGDSGPYLEYTYARTNSLLFKAKTEGISPEVHGGGSILEIERTLYRFPEIVERALNEFSPNYIVTYLTQIARAFNAWYGAQVIVSKKDKNSPHFVAITMAVNRILKNGLYILAIHAPERM